MVLLQELEQWHTLPSTGGYLDQPMFLMSCLRVVRRAIRGYSNSKERQAEQQDEVDNILSQLPGGLEFWRT